MGSVEQQQIDELERRISALPAGSVTKKSVRGKEYFYRRWTENGKRHEKYLPADEVPAFKAGVEERKRLEQELKSLKARAGAHPSPTIDSSSFTATIRTGIELRAFTARVRSFKRRACYQQLRDYLRSAQQDKVFVLYGLRRTGKTTLIRQALDEMSDAELGRAAFIQVTASDTLASLNRDLRALEEAGVRYVFIDEVTLIEDFVKGAALFSDVFATCGMWSCSAAQTRSGSFLPKTSSSMTAASWRTPRLSPTESSSRCWGSAASTSTSATAAP